MITDGVLDLLDRWSMNRACVCITDVLLLSWPTRNPDGRAQARAEPVSPRSCRDEVDPSNASARIRDNRYTDARTADTAAMPLVIGDMRVL